MQAQRNPPGAKRGRQSSRPPASPVSQFRRRAPTATPTPSASLGQSSPSVFGTSCRLESGIFERSCVNTSSTITTSVITKASTTSSRCRSGNQARAQSDATNVSAAYRPTIGGTPQSAANRVFRTGRAPLHPQERGECSVGARRRIVGHNGHVIKTSLAHAKAHLSALRRSGRAQNKHILILRHGKPAAAIVPVELAALTRKRTPPMSDEDAERSVLAFVDEFSGAEPQTSAVDDLLQGRR